MPFSSIIRRFVRPWSDRLKRPLAFLAACLAWALVAAGPAAAAVERKVLRMALRNMGRKGAGPKRLAQKGL